MLCLVAKHCAILLYINDLHNGGGNSKACNYAHHFTARTALQKSRGICCGWCHIKDFDYYKVNDYNRLFKIFACKKFRRAKKPRATK